MATRPKRRPPPTAAHGDVLLSGLAGPVGAPPRAAQELGTALAEALPHMDLVRSAVSPLPAVQASHHEVQFYDREPAAAGIARFLGDGLAHGRAAVVIATPEHRQAIAAAL